VNVNEKGCPYEEEALSHLVKPVSYFALSQEISIKAVWVDTGSMNMREYYAKH
jgi:hypothetical protein